MVKQLQLYARLMANELYSHAIDLPPHEDLWADACLRATDALNRVITVANPGNKTPHELFLGKSAPLKLLPFLKPIQSTNEAGPQDRS
ncbi:unnamed protein product [Discosporangium mesarthrocarpum]